MLLSIYKEELDNLNMKELVQYLFNKNDDRILCLETTINCFYYLMTKKLIPIQSRSLP